MFCFILHTRIMLINIFLNINIMYVLYDFDFIILYYIDLTF